MDDADYRERLSRDIAAWEREGLITPTQAETLHARTGAAAPRRLGALRMGWLVTAISVIGAIVLGAGIVLLVAANWRDMPEWLRTALIVMAMLAAYTVAYVLMYRYEMQRVGSAFLLLGAILFEAGLFLVAAAYDLPLETGAYFGLAAAGILPLAYLFASRIVLLFAIANAAMWAFQSMALRYPDDPESLAAPAVMGVFGVAVYAIGRIHDTRPALQHFADVYVLAGALIAMGLLYLFSYRDVWDGIRSGTEIESYAAPAIIYVSVGIAAALIAVQYLLRGGSLEAKIDTAIQASMVGLVAVVGTWPDWAGWVLVFNLAYFSVAAAAVTRGYLRADEPYINIGLAFVALGLLSRYIDTFWSLMARSLFFIVGGLLLLGVAFALERLRRELLRTMEDEAPGDPPDVVPAEGRAP